MLPAGENTPDNPAWLAPIVRTGLPRPSLLSPIGLYPASLPTSQRHPSVNGAATACSRGFECCSRDAAVRSRLGRAVSGSHAVLRSPLSALCPEFFRYRRHIDTNVVPPRRFPAAMVEFPMVGAGRAVRCSCRQPCVQARAVVRSGRGARLPVWPHRADRVVRQRSEDVPRLGCVPV